MSEKLPTKQAYDFRRWGELTLLASIPAIAEFAKCTVRATLQWLDESAVKSETPIDDMARPVYSAADKWLDPAVDLLKKIPFFAKYLK